jgi:hypothetical protein
VPLGLSITGGNEHGVPIIISEIHANGCAARDSQLFIGDAILSVASDKKRFDLKECMHSQAVETLSSLSGKDVELEVYFMPPEYDDETHTITELNYPYVDDQGTLHLQRKNSSKQEKNEANSRRTSMSPDLIEKIDDTTCLLLNENQTKDEKSITADNANS